MSRSRIFLLLSIIVALVVLGALAIYGYRLLRQPQSPPPTQDVDTVSCQSLDDCQWYTRGSGESGDTRILCGNQQYINSCSDCQRGSGAKGTGSFCVCVNSRCQIDTPISPRNPRPSPTD